MNILCPTDFSPVADYAFEAACKLAAKLGAKLYLFHCQELGKDWSTDEEWNEQFDPLQQAATSAALEQMQKLQEEARHRKVECETRFSEGVFFTELENLTNEIPFTFVVMGSHGASGKREWLIGSNTQKAIRKLHVDTLVIKSPVKELKFPKAVFASGLFAEDQIAFRHFLELADDLGVTDVHVLTIHTSGLFQPPQIVLREALKDFEKIAGSFKAQTHYHRDISVEAGIRHFVDDEKADLIAISNHVRHPFKRLFRGSTVEMVVNHANVPVLSIDYPTGE